METEDELSHDKTLESISWAAPRSLCSTPNSLEWDFKESTLSLQDRPLVGSGPAGENVGLSTGGGIQVPGAGIPPQMDLETEQLIQEIELLAARALSDTGHGLNDPPR